MKSTLSVHGQLWGGHLDYIIERESGTETLSPYLILFSVSPGNKSCGRGVQCKNVGFSNIQEM